MLAEIVTEYLEERMPDKIIRVPSMDDSTPFIRIKAVSADFGDIELYDEGNQIAIEFGRFTYSHISNNDNFPEKEKALRIASEVHSMLEATLNDEYEFWRSDDGSGGFQAVELPDCFLLKIFLRIVTRKSSRTFYRWSGATRSQ